MVIGMGHTSTIDHDYMVFALSGVSPVVEQTIIAERFSSFTIKSRREVDFSSVGFYTPDFHTEDGSISPDNELLKEKYNKYMQSLFDSYEYFVSSGITKEDARFVLPYSYHSEIIMGLDGTSLARMISLLTKTKYSNITELKELGESLKKISETRAPYINTVVDKERKVLESETEQILKDLGITKEYDLLVYFLNNKGLAISREQVLSKVWDENYFGSDRVVDDTLRRLRKKMPEINIRTIYGF